ncbi:MAG: hypothetical protein E2O92_01180 [Alphaproteobacteria bacterium]|nr:MAG: hypothetical protein E2O92_01180 [Alphaproteobacteria bacterium]
MPITVVASIKKEATINGLLNAVFNGLIPWFQHNDKTTVPLMGEGGFGMDIAITAFILLFLVSMIVIGAQRKKARKEQVMGFEWDDTKRLHRLLRKVPGKFWAAGLVFGLFGLLVVTPLTLGPLALLGIDALTPLAYAIFKGIWAGLMAAIMIVPIILVALAGQPKTN